VAGRAARLRRSRRIERSGTPVVESRNRRIVDCRIPHVGFVVQCGEGVCEAPTPEADAGGAVEVDIQRQRMSAMIAAIATEGNRGRRPCRRSVIVRMVMVFLAVWLCSVKPAGAGVVEGFDGGGVECGVLPDASFVDDAVEEVGPAWIDADEEGTGIGIQGLAPVPSG